MKVLVFALVATINLIGCNTGSLDYQPSLMNEKVDVSPTPIDGVCINKQYKPKSQSLIASMSPRQLIDELIKSHPSGFDTYDEGMNYVDSIEKRIRQAGVKALPIFTEYFDDSYNKQSSFVCDKNRFDKLDKIAWDLDRFDFRLRGREKGKETIETFELAIKRIEKLGLAKESVSYYKDSLNELKGINIYDVSIQDTLWVRYAIKMSDDDLTGFSNFLVELDSTYPSWSDMDFIKDYSRINEAGNPAQIYVLNKPGRFYKAYQNFKKQSDEPSSETSPSLTEQR